MKLSKNFGKTTMKVVTGTKLSAKEIADQLIDTAKLTIITGPLKTEKTQKSRKLERGFLYKLCYKGTITGLKCKKFINSTIGSLHRKEAL